MKWLASSASSLALFLAAALWPASASAQAGDTLRPVRQYHEELATMITVARNAPGPYTLGGTCSWCSIRAWWALDSCMASDSESWSTSLEFSLPRQALVAAAAQAWNSLQDFGPSYSVTLNWFNGLGAFSDTFAARADRIIAIQNEIGAGIGPTDRQRETVVAVLRQMTDDVTILSGQMRVATSPLAAQLDQQGAYRERIRQAMVNADGDSKASLAKAEKDADTHKCKASAESIAAIRRDLDRSGAELAAAFARLESTGRESQKALNGLLSFILDSQTDMTTVQDLLAVTATDKLGGFLQRLHINGAKNRWREVAMRGG